MFKPGDYVTGRDRSYKRSIYRVVSIVDDRDFTLQFICLNGRLGPHDPQYCTRVMAEFRPASTQEARDEMMLAYRNYLTIFVEALVKRSSQELQLFGSRAHQL